MPARSTMDGLPTQPFGQEPTEQKPASFDKSGPDSSGQVALETLDSTQTPTGSWAVHTSVQLFQLTIDHAPSGPLKVKQRNGKRFKTRTALCATVPPAVPGRKRKKSMSFRPGQSGAIERKGRRWIGRYYEDVPGSTERKRTSVTLGSVSVMTKSEARRKLRSLLEKNSLNEDKHLERVINSRTFRQEAEWWRENKLSLYKPSVQETMGSHLDKYLIPRLGDVPLEQITERRVQELVAELSRTEYVVPNKRKTSKRLSPKSVRNIIGVLKLVLGKKVWRDWSIVLPEIPETEQRYFTEDEMRRIIAASRGQWHVLFATLASTGLRAGEAFGLHVEDLDLEAGTITVRRSVWNGEEVTPKTKKGYRVVNIDPALADLLREYLDGRRGGRVFQSRTGTPLSKGNARRKLHETLRPLGISRGGLHAFRHGRVSVLQTNGVPGDLTKEWVGHSSLRTTSRYTHFSDEYKRKTAQAMGLKMEEKLPNGPHGPRFRDPEGFSGSR